MLNISFPFKYEPEKTYACEVILGHFLNIEYKLQFSGEEQNVLLWLNGEDRYLSFPSILFETDRADWLKRCSFPAMPLKLVSLGKLTGGKFYSDQIPLLFFRDQPNEGQDKNHEYFEGDIFGSVFFLLTLYEEVDNEVRDKHGRFPLKESLLFPLYHKRALVNEYIEVLRYLLVANLGCNIVSNRVYTVHLSHDVDWPLANLYDLKFHFKESAKDLLERHDAQLFFRRFYSRFFASGLAIKALDPNNNFKYIMDVSESMDLRSSFFFIPAPEPAGQYSPEIRYQIQSPFFLQLFQEIHRRGHSIGVHPGYFTFCDAQNTASGFHRLRHICDGLGIKQQNWGGRQHYLRWKNPESWQIWDDMGADFDSSLGWAEDLGFRGSSCIAYPVFDLILRKQRKLIEYPLMVMDVTAFALGSMEDYFDQIVEISNVCRFFRGDFTLLYHNNYIIGKKEQENYTLLLKALKS